MKNKHLIPNTLPIGAFNEPPLPEYYSPLSYWICDNNWHRINDRKASGSSYKVKIYEDTGTLCLLWKSFSESHGIGNHEGELVGKYQITDYYSCNGNTNRDVPHVAKKYLYTARPATSVSSQPNVPPPSQKSKSKIDWQEIYSSLDSIKYPPAYILNKGVAVDPRMRAGSDKEGNYIAIPMYKSTPADYGKLCGIQKIYDTGAKKYWTGTAKKGSVFILDGMFETGYIFLTEGYATACSVLDIIRGRGTVAVCFDCGNLYFVAYSLKKNDKFKDWQFVFCADNDLNNTGVAHAEHCKELLNGAIVTPPILDSKSTDWNDFARFDYEEAQRVFFSQIKMTQRSYIESTRLFTKNALRDKTQGTQTQKR